jgi:hypothetical protein
MANYIHAWADPTAQAVTGRRGRYRPGEAADRVLSDLWQQRLARVQIKAPGESEFLFREELWAQRHEAGYRIGW